MKLHFLLCLVFAANCYSHPWESIDKFHFLRENPKDVDILIDRLIINDWEYRSQLSRKWHNLEIGDIVLSQIDSYLNVIGVRHA